MKSRIAVVLIAAALVTPQALLFADSATGTDASATTQTSKPKHHKKHQHKKNKTASNAAANPSETPAPAPTSAPQ